MSGSQAQPGPGRRTSAPSRAPIWPDRLVVRALTPADDEVIAGWRYEGRWSVYDWQPQDAALTSRDGYLAVAGAADGPLVGFCCSGAEARVQGLPAEPGVLDIGVGMDPAWVGLGHGLAFGAAVLSHYRTAAGVTRLRAVVQSWNERSLRLTRRLGFTEAGTHLCEQGGALVGYTVLLAAAGSDG